MNCVLLAKPLVFFQPLYIYKTTLNTIKIAYLLEKIGFTCSTKDGQNESNIVEYSDLKC